MASYSILPPERIGTAVVTDDGFLDIGGLRVPVGQWGHSGQGIQVYACRSSRDLSIMEVHMARHDGLAQIELDIQNEEAGRYALGPREYWRGEIVGKWTMGEDHHVMTDAEFEEYWEEGGMWDEEAE